MELEADVPELPFATQVANLQRDLADLAVDLGEHVGDLAAHHHGDDVIACHIGRLDGRDVFAVSEHGQLVSDLEQLVHLVGDIDDTDTLGAQIANDAEQMFDFAFRDGRSRLVHDQHVGII